MMDFFHHIVKNMISFRSFCGKRSLVKITCLTFVWAFFIFVLPVFFLTSGSALATNDLMEETFADTAIGTTLTLPIIIARFVQIFFGILGVLAVLLLIYGGFIWMTSQGDPDKVNKAKQIIYNAIIGLIIIFSAFAIATFILGVLRGVTGTGGTGDPSSRVPGGFGDWSRSAIGAGPIESVYPSPNSTNVPINTRIAVTFKENIVPDSICEVNPEGICAGGKMKNVAICEVGASGPDCLADSAFNALTFASTTVRQATNTDLRTFVFETPTFLGNEDNIIRTFKVLLESGITAQATGRSIFSGFRTDYYNWAFKTNGQLDLNPPEIARLGIYPNPDDNADTYPEATEATFGEIILTLNNVNIDSPTMLKNSSTGAYVPAVGPLSNIPISLVSGNKPEQFQIFFNGLLYSSSSVDGNYQFVVSSDGTSITLKKLSFWKDELGVVDEDGILNIVNGSINFDGAGFTLTGTGAWPQGTIWQLEVKAPQRGDFLIFNDGTADTRFLFATSSYPLETVTRNVIIDDLPTLQTFNLIKTAEAEKVTSTINKLNDVLGNKITATRGTGNEIIITPDSAGVNRMTLTSNLDSDIEIDGDLAGTNRLDNKVQEGARDPYNNEIFKIRFNKAISPIGIEDFVKVYVNNSTTVIPASTTLNNQYTEIELRGTVPCGKNSCGDEMYCWLDPAIYPNATSVPVRVEVVAATLKTCDTANEGWCTTVGGTCTADSRCSVNVDEGAIWYYPQAGGINGVTDMSNNSFSGNFVKVRKSGQLVSKAFGQSGDDSALIFGRSGLPYYSANAKLNDIGRFEYQASPDSGYGDDFSWSFFVSTLIDRTSPLLTSIEPVGDYPLGRELEESFRDPVVLNFDRLMRSATIKPGYGYGTSTDDSAWHTRYLLLTTLTQAANPVGYWTANNNIDDDRDNWADFSQVLISHNPFDQAVRYGPLSASGIQSISQNCFLPGSGPQNAGAEGVDLVAPAERINYCSYNSDGSTIGCVTDSGLANAVTSTNPASYGYMNCNQIQGAVPCTATCYAHRPGNDLGSWIITKDFSTDIGDGKTGCCFGRCQ